MGNENPKVFDILLLRGVATPAQPRTPMVNRASAQQLTLLFEFRLTSISIF